MLYGHGDDLYKYNTTIKGNFSSNVYHLGTDDRLVTHLQNSLPKIENYPAPNADHLSIDIANHHNLNGSNVLVANGATEAFYTIAQAFKQFHVRIGIPTFMEYESACKSQGVHIEFFQRKDILNQSFVEQQLIFLCNPNNPDGYSNSLKEIEQLLKNNPKTTFVIDEAYIDFTTEITSCTELLKQFKNLIIVKSLTKVFAIPGLRLGYILSSEHIIKQLLHYKMPWSVNALAIEVGRFIFKHYDELYPDMNTLISDCKKLQQDIEAIEGFNVTPSHTNYFLVKLKKPKATELKAYLVNEYQLLIRDATNFNGLDAHYIRIACQNNSKNQQLVNALQQWTW